MEKLDTFHKLIGVAMIAAGVIFYPTPVPGTTLLIILGMMWLMGRKKTLSFLKKNLSNKTFNKLKTEKIFRE